MPISAILSWPLLVNLLHVLCTDLSQPRPTLLLALPHCEDSCADHLQSTSTSSTFFFLFLMKNFLVRMTSLNCAIIIIWTSTQYIRIQVEDVFFLVRMTPLNCAIIIIWTSTQYIRIQVENVNHRKVFFFFLLFFLTIIPSYLCNNLINKYHIRNW